VSILRYRRSLHNKREHLTTNQQVGCSSHPGRASLIPQENQRLRADLCPALLSIIIPLNSTYFNLIVGILTVVVLEQRDNKEEQGEHYHQGQ
jgi:hypothetical protein